MQPKNIVGKTFGKLHVNSRSHKESKSRCAYWNCLCECGNNTVVAGTALRAGNIKSCGCLSKLNICHQKFGKLLAIKELIERKNNHVLWLCKCECGNDIKVSASNLVNGRKTSCGCLSYKIKNT
jgi:hypothetical protein